MADKFYLYQLCPVCDGDGVVTTTAPLPPNDITNTECPECLGPNAKHQKAGYLYTGLAEKVN